MAIAMTCPQCSAHFNFTDAWAGKRARCQRCQTLLALRITPRAGVKCDRNRNHRELMLLRYEQDRAVAQRRAFDFERCRWPWPDSNNRDDREKAT